MTTIVIADDHAVVRSGLRMLLEAEDDLEVVAEAGDVASTLRYVRGHRPRVLVLDVHMPDGSGGGGRARGSSLESLAELRAASPDTAIVVLTMQTDPAFAR